MQILVYLLISFYYLLSVKKWKFTLEQAMKAQRGNRGIVLLFF